MGTAQTYLLLLAATLLVEVPLAAALAGPRRRRDTWIAAAALNLLTHPMATGLTWLLGAPWLPVELAVVVAEAVGYRALTPLGQRRSIAIALTANALSALVGVLLVLG